MYSVTYSTHSLSLTHAHGSANSGLKQTLSKIIAHLGLQLCTLNTADETSYGLWKQELPQSPQQQETISAPPPPPSPPLLTIQEYQSEYFNRIFSLVTTQSSDTPIEVKYCLLEGLNEVV